MKEFYNKLLEFIFNHKKLLIIIAVVFILLLSGMTKSHASCDFTYNNTNYSVPDLPEECNQYYNYTIWADSGYGVYYLIIYKNYVEGETVPYYTYGDRTSGHGGVVGYKSGNFLHNYSVYAWNVKRLTTWSNDPVYTTNHFGKFDTRYIEYYNDQFAHLLFSTVPIYYGVNSSVPVQNIPTSFDNELPNLRLNITINYPTNEPIEIFTENNIKPQFYVKYSDDGVNFIDCIRSNDTIDGGYWYWTYATHNGTYYFRVYRNENDYKETSIEITNWYSSTDLGLHDESVLKPVMSFEKQNEHLFYRTQSLTSEEIKRYILYFSAVNDDNTFYPSTPMNDYNSLTKEDLFKYRFRLDESGRYYYMFYDKELSKYGSVYYFDYESEKLEEYLSLASNGSNNDDDNGLHSLLMRKFGLFYSIKDFIIRFWNSLSVDNIPRFEITLPSFLGGGNVNAIDFTFYNQYRGFIHGIIIALSYYLFIRKMMVVIPKIIHE